jgi:hypothetical protein
LAFLASGILCIFEFLSAHLNHYLLDSQPRVFNWFLSIICILSIILKQSTSIFEAVPLYWPRKHSVWCKHTHTALNIEGKRLAVTPFQAQLLIIRKLKTEGLVTLAYDISSL